MKCYEYCMDTAVRRVYKARWTVAVTEGKANSESIFLVRICLKTSKVIVSPATCTETRFSPFVVKFQVDWMHIWILYNYELRQYDIPYHYSVAAPDAPLRFPPPTLEKEESREAEKSPKGGHRFGGWWACSDGRFLILCTMGFTDFGRVGPDLPLFWGTTSPCYFISI